MNSGFDMLYRTVVGNGCFGLRCIFDTSRHPQPQPRFAACTSTSRIKRTRDMRTLCDAMVFSQARKHKTADRLLIMAL